jgi:hypothetical protein
MDDGLFAFQPVGGGATGGGRIADGATYTGAGFGAGAAVPGPDRCAITRAMPRSTARSRDAARTLAAVMSDGVGRLILLSSYFDYSTLFCNLFHGLFEHWPM